MAEQAIFRLFLVMMCLAFAIHSIISARNRRPYTPRMFDKIIGKTGNFFFGEKWAITYEEFLHSEEYAKHTKTIDVVSAFMFIILIIFILTIG